MRNKFGKPSASIIKIKNDFFQNNDKLFKENTKIYNNYIKQPVRRKCKNCNRKIEYTDFFTKQKVKYTFCNLCKHLNGIYDDTEEFCRSVYSDNKGLGYSKSYYEKNIKAYNIRTKNIYIPKAKFLLDNLKKEKEKISQLNFIDLGAGSGYFLKALLGLGIKKLAGYEASKTQVQLANKMLGSDILHHHDINEINNIVSKIDSDVLSMIGVLEHMQKPYELLREIKKNKNIKYLYISVPTFSFSVFFEMVFPSVMQRQLSPDHTHLYTQDSLKWLKNKFKFKEVAAWWFGTDMMDLHRNMMVSLLKDKKTNNISSLWSKTFLKCLDELQLIIDKKFLSSEVHLLLKC